GDDLALFCLFLGQAALLVFLTAAAGTGIIASGCGHWGQRLGTEGTLPLYSALLTNASFHELLLAFDRDLADSHRASGCTCGGALHSAKYPRKVRGLPPSLRTSLGREYTQRFSFCCAIDGCRSRATPPSMRFLGRKVYCAAIIVVASIMWHGI